MLRYSHHIFEIKTYFVMQNTDCQLFGDSVEEELLLNGKGSTQEQRDDLLKLYGL